jgi:exosome complex exonuclease DIS3/RRP44
MSEHEKFMKAFLEVLTNEKVIQTLQEIISNPLSFEIKNISDSHNKLMKEFQSVKESNEQLQKNISVLHKAITEKDAAIKSLQNTVEELQLKVDEQEQYERRNSLRLSNLPERENENLHARFMKINDERLFLDDLEEHDIDQIHRVGRYDSKKTRQVLIKFATYRARNMVYKARKKLLNPPDPPEEIDPEIRTDEDYDDDDEEPEEPEDHTLKLFVNEDLTKRRSTLLWKARIQKKEKKILDCWSFDGRLYVKDKHARIKTLDTEHDLNELIK